MRVKNHISNVSANTQRKIELEFNRTQVKHFDHFQITLFQLHCNHLPSQVNLAEEHIYSGVSFLSQPNVFYFNLVTVQGRPSRCFFFFFFFNVI